MYKGKHLNGENKTFRKATTVVISVLLLVTVMIGGTIAFLITATNPVVNKFTPSQVSCSVTENFDGTKKTNVNVTNTSDIKAYIRVKLVTYRVNEQGQHIGGVAEIPAFTPGENWVKNGEYYYYKLPVDPGAEPAADLIDSNGIQLKGTYADVDGGKQVIEVMAEAIQADGVDAKGNKPIELAWGVDIEGGQLKDATIVTQ